jgi:hypothetical protein
MGTLFEQPARDEHLVRTGTVLDHIDVMKKVAHDTGIPLDQAIEVWRVLEQARANHIAVANGNIHDEQMADLGLTFEAARMAMDSVATALNNMATELHFLTKKGE